MHLGTFFCTRYSNYPLFARLYSVDGVWCDGQKSATVPQNVWTTASSFAYLLGREQCASTMHDNYSR